ncbi:MAG TPA: MoxR family ATPase [Streptosporangiaceae bacterium]
MSEWPIYQGTGEPHDWDLPDPPGWRTFAGEPSLDTPSENARLAERRLGALARAVTYRPGAEEVALVNAALYLRRPLLLTGKPGTGKSTLAHSIARELQLGPVLGWPITSRSTRQDGLYHYDALARLQDAGLARESGSEPVLDIGRYLRLGPLGTALLPYRRPRILLIDELDKSDIDLPNDLLTIFEEGDYEIPELSRIAAELPVANVRTHDGTDTVPITEGRVTCAEFPLVIITSNGERDFPPPFLRRCLRLELQQPTRERLESIVRAHLGDAGLERSGDLIDQFINRRGDGDLATDQLLNAIFLTFHRELSGNKELLVTSVLRSLTSVGT